MLSLLHNLMIPHNLHETCYYRHCKTDFRRYFYINIHFIYLLTFNVDFILNFQLLYAHIYLLRQAILKLPNYSEVYICMFNIFMNKKFKNNSYHP